MASWFLFGSLIAFFTLGVPIFLALGASCLVGILVYGRMPITLLAQQLYQGADSFTLLAIPLFLLAGNLMDSGGISRRLVNFANALSGHIAGGLAVASIIASMFFAGISGAAVADATAIGVIMIPAMFALGYDKDFVVAIQSAAGSIGVIIPPSIPMVIYGVAAEVSIGRLFLGGFIPGILIGLSLIILSVVTAKRRNWPTREKASLGEVWDSFKSASWALVMPVIIMGGIIFGIFTPTESAVVAVFYGLLVGLFVYKELKVNALPKILLDTALGTATVMMVIASAKLFGWVITSFQVPQAMVAFMQSITHSRVVFLALVNVILLIAGTFLDGGAAILILTPVLLPLATSYGVDPVHFGVIMVVNLAVGMLTPPYGVTLFACAGIAEMPVNKTLRALVPVWGAMLIIVVLITFIPQLVTFIPNLVMN